MENIVVVDDPQFPPWGNDRTCPTCGETDLPLHTSTSTEAANFTLSYITHCGSSWVRGPIGRK